MSVMKVVGKIDRTYADRQTGAMKTYRRVYGIWEDKTDRELEGHLVEELRIPNAVDLSKVSVGQSYRVYYEQSQYGSGNRKFADIAAFELVKA